MRLIDVVLVSAIRFQKNPPNFPHKRISGNLRLPCFTADAPERFINKGFKVVPGKGIEPPLSCLNQILSLARLPVPPPRHVVDGLRVGKYM